MIPHYEKRCVEIAFKSTDSKRVISIVEALPPAYRNTFDAFLSAVPGKGKHTGNPITELETWLKGPKNQPLLIGMYAPKGLHDPVIFIQFQAIENLETK